MFEESVMAEFCTHSPSSNNPTSSEVSFNVMLQFWDLLTSCLLNFSFDN